jgi:hypothetical protein
LNLSITEAPDDGTQPVQRCVPPTRYSEILGQIEAIGIEFHQRLGGGVPDRGVAYRASAI